MAKAKASALPVKTAPVVPASNLPDITITLELHPTAKAEGEQALLQSHGLAILDRDSHESVRRLTKGWKARKREIEGWHRDKMLGPLKKATDWARDQMKDDLDRFELAIAAGEKVDLEFVRAEERRIREETERRRAEEEARERARREKEAADAEAAALALEAGSDELSVREQSWVASYVRGVEAGQVTPQWLVGLAKSIGYKDPAGAASRLMAAPKINAAIQSAMKAAAIRKEAQAAKAAPINVTVDPVESQLGKVSGTSVRTYYACGVVDLRALVLAVADDIVNGDGTKLQALQANMTFLNAEARQLREMFSKVHPYAALVKRDGVAS